MATVSFTIDGDNYTTAQTVNCNVGDTLNINYTRIKTTVTTSYWAITVSGATDVPGCTYATFDTASYNNYIKGNLTGTPTTVGTYVLKMGRFRPSASTKLVEGSDLTLIVSPVSTTYYSNLYYNANTGSGTPSDDKDTKITTSKPSDRITSISTTIPTLENGVFKGWSKTLYTPGTGTAEYKGGDSITIPYLTTNTGITLYAVWGVKKKYYSKLTYNTLGGLPTVADDIVEKLEEEKPDDRVSNVTPTLPSMTGYMFEGWSTTQYPIGTGTAEYFPNDTITVPYVLTDTGIILYAVWRKDICIQVYIGDTKVGIYNEDKNIKVK